MFLTYSMTNVFCRDDECSRLSPEAKDLICKLLTVDPNQRLSAKDALTHPWMVGTDDVTRSTTERKITTTVEGLHSKKMKMKPRNIFLRRWRWKCQRGKRPKRKWQRWKSCRGKRCRGNWQRG